MSIISKWFKSQQPYIEKELEESYIHMFLLFPYGMTLKEARLKVKEGIKLCKDKAIREGTDNLPENYGDLLIRTAKSENPETKKIVDKARREGATDEDIREFWNLNDLKRRMIIYSENVLLLVIYNSLYKPSLSEDEAKEKDVEIRKKFPIYGDPDDTNVTIRRDRPLPYELRARVERWKIKLLYEIGEEEFKKKSYRYSTFNALVRDEIRKGNL